MEPNRKKYLGQHFLTDKNIAGKIADSLSFFGTTYTDVLEVGPGEGMLTRYLLEKDNINLALVELDKDLIEGLSTSFGKRAKVIHADFLKTDLSQIFSGQFGIAGNFPYNISSQILVKTVENRQQIPELIGMFQRELAERIAASPGSKRYGRISVLTQLFYNINLLFRVSSSVFSPPPKVESAVIRLVRKTNIQLECDDHFLFEILRITFGQRRKKLKNTLSQTGRELSALDVAVLNARPEELNPEDFVKIALQLKPRP